MLYVTAQDILIPKLGLGTWLIYGPTCMEVVKKALAVGYRHIDTAQVYENEAFIGQAIAASTVPRQDIFLTTKIWRDNVSKRHLEPSVDASLKKLKTDYVDLLLIHWPVNEIPLDETMEILQKVQSKGKARLIGVSNFTTTQLHQCVDKLKVPLVTNQVEYHPYLSQNAILEFLRSHSMFLTAYCPLGRAKLGKDNTLCAIAKNYNKTVWQVILRWHMQQRDVVAIPKAATSAHIEENFAIFDFTLNDVEMTAITELTERQQRMINPEFAPQWDMPQAA